MATYTPRLGLKRPEPTDPFLTQDFFDNYNTLDSAPGLHVCTSSTMPTWGAAEAGRGIYMTDHKYMMFWNGTSWDEPVQSVPGMANSLMTDVELSRNTTTVFNIATYNISRPARLHLIFGVQFAIVSNRRQWMRVRPVINGVDAQAGHTNVWRHSGHSNLGNYWTYNAIPALGTVANQPAGSVTVGVKIMVGSDPDPIRYYGSKTQVFLGRSSGQL